MEEIAFWSRGEIWGVLPSFARSGFGKGIRAREWESGIVAVLSVRWDLRFRDWLGRAIGGNCARMGKRWVGGGIPREEVRDSLPRLLQVGMGKALMACVRGGVARLRRRSRSEVRVRAGSRRRGGG